MSKEQFEKVKEIIKANIKDARLGLFFTSGTEGDSLEQIYEEDGVEVYICYWYSYYEVFGLSKEEEEELTKFYESLGGL